MKLNPYEQGQADCRNNLPLRNPYLAFSAKWALYNRGYNTEAKTLRLMPFDSSGVTVVDAASN